VTRGPRFERVLVPGLAVAVGVMLSLCGATARGGDPPVAALDPHRVAWRELHFEAHRLGIAAHIEIRLIAPTTARTDPPPSAQVGAGERSAVRGEGLWLESTTHLPGRTFLARERLDPWRAAAFEIIDTETGAKHHRKAYTLGDHGFALDLLEPASLTELMLDPERWTRHLTSVFSYPSSLGREPAVTGPAGLLYALAAGSVTTPGDSTIVNVLVQTQVERVTVAAEGVEPLQLDYEQVDGGHPTIVHAQVAALRLVAHSSPVVDPSAPSAFRIFGLEGVVEILWDGQHRLPLEMSGQVKLLGHVEVRLASLTLR
jgi:hypothetical protein